MRRNKHNNGQYYTNFLNWYIVSLLLVSAVFISIISSSFYNKAQQKSKFEDLQVLILDLEKLNEDVHSQLEDRFVNVHDVFLNFGDLQDRTIKFVGLNDTEVIDSLAKIGSVVKYFDVESKIKHNIEILHFLDKVDDLLLTTDEFLLFESENNIREITNYGKGFKKNWTQQIHQLDRSLQTANQIIIKDISYYKNRIYLTSIVFIFFLLTYIIVLYLVSFRILKNVKILKVHTKMLMEGKNPSAKSVNLKGELRNVHFNLKYLFSDFLETQKMLAQIYSDKKTTDIEMKKFEKNIFFESVSKLKNQLSHLEENEKTRNWNLNGINILTNVVNEYSSEPRKLFQQYLKTLVKYINGVQGGVFVKESDSILSLETSYAYDRLKKLTKIINYGEGIVGEVWAEEKMLYVENVPENHFDVKSSLGNATPVALLLVPLMERSECYGVLEISSFKKFTDNEKEFVTKACEILAAATANVKVNQRTKKLLADSQVLTEKLQSKENETQIRIEDLKLDVVTEKKRLFAKDSQIKDLMLNVANLKSEIKILEKSMENNSLAFENKLEESLKNNSVITDMKAKLTDYEAIKVDLEETIRIKNLKIDRLKKKLLNHK